MKNFLLLLSLSLFSTISYAKPGDMPIQRGFVKLPDGVDRYVEYSAPKPGRPWIIFVNGLVYELDRWEGMDNELRSQGYGILHYYFRGQDWTLEREAQQFGDPLFFKTGLVSQDFAAELAQILQRLNINEKVVVVGLSYGSHIAATFAETYPDHVDQVVFLAPLVISLENYEPQGAWLDWNLAWVRLMWGPMFYEYAYRQIYKTYLGKRVEDRVPDHLSGISEIYKESLFHLVRAARDFDLRQFKFSKLARNSVYFMVSEEEKDEMFQDQLKAFKGVSENSQGSLVWLPDATHAIPDSEPRLAARYLQYFMARDARLQRGKMYKSTSQGLVNW